MLGQAREAYLPAVVVQLCVMGYFISLDDLPKFDASEPLRAPDSPFDDDGPTASIRGSMTAFERHIAASSPKNKNLA